MRRAALALGALLIALVPAGIGTTASAAPSESAGTISVMTRNMDLGSDLGPVLTATSTAGFLHGVTTVYQEIAASNMAERAMGVAEEIGAAMPSVVSVQEVSLVQRFVPTSTGLALLDQIDQLGDLRSALSQLGLHYTLAAAINEWNNIAPSDAGYFVRVQDEEAILVRSDLPASKLSFANAQTGHFTNLLSFASPFGTVTAARGWASIDVTTEGSTVRVVDTHLEAESAAVAAAQAAELLAGPAATDLPVIVAADLNSGPGLDTSAYDTVTASLTDTWSATKPTQDGFTWPLHGEDAFPYTSTPNERIDVIAERGLTPVTDVRFGTDDLTSSGLYPSDHAGVLARMKTR